MRAYSRHALLQINLSGSFTYTQEVILNLAYKGIIIKEVPIKIEGIRKHGKSRVASNLFRYGIRTGMIIFRAFRDYKPLYFFGIISLFLFLISFCLMLFVAIHFANVGSFFPHKWAVFAAALSGTFAFVILIIGLLADMLDRVRMNQEKILYLLQKRIYKD